MSATKACIIDPIWDQFAALLPAHQEAHPLGCHRHRVPDRVVFDKLVQVLVFGCTYHRIADDSCSATTLRRRRDDWIVVGIMDRLLALVLDAYDRMIGLELGDIAIDECITKAPFDGETTGRSPVDRGKQGLKRSTVVDANGIPLGAVAAPPNRHDSPLLDATIDMLDRIGPLPETMTVHLDRGYDSGVTREKLSRRGFRAEISERGTPAPLSAIELQPVERINAWSNAHKKPIWCTERRAAIVMFWMAFSAVIIIVRRLIREGWTPYRWDSRTCCKP